MALTTQQYSEDEFFGYLDKHNDINSPDNIHYNAQCPRCGRNYNLVHNDCGEYIDMCVCSEEDLDTIYHCGHCLITFDRAKDWEIETEYIQDMEASPLFLDPKEYEITTGTNKGGATSLPTVKTSINYIKCNHKHHEVQLKDGTKIFCSSAYDNSPIDPDFGLYADHIWDPYWRNEFIAWDDGGLPTDKDTAMTQIKEAFQIAQTGKMVEIGCIGGHGRTGTILALMYMLSANGEVDSKAAIDFVRSEYCKSAIETYSQEWYVAYASSIWFKKETAPPEPDPANDVCSMVDHVAMILRGHKFCLDQGKKCKYFKEDLETYEEHKKTPTGGTILHFAMEKMGSYDLAYGGFVLPEDDSKFPCTPLDHYSMIAKGHDRCIRIGEDCSLWQQDYEEFMNKGTISEIDFPNTKIVGSALDIYNSYPTAEELEESKTNG